MSENQVAKALRQRGLKVASFAREIGINQQTLYNVVKKESVDNISISIFLKIAAGLGMTAEELYYGEAPNSPDYSDSRQMELNRHFESLNEQGKTDLLGFVKSYAADPERRMSKERERGEDRASLGA